MSWISFSIDVEEWFHILDTDRIPPRSEWDSQPNRVEDNTRRILDLLDRAGVPGTFFTLGWVAERHPDLVREIARRGHEVASHGHEHKLAYQVGRSAFREDSMRSKATLEDVIGEEVLGFRAAGFSITERTPWAFEELASLGFRYDSSVFPARRRHGGLRGALSVPHRIFSPGSLSLIEFPVAPLEAGPFHLPFSGGGYLRLYPVPVIRWCFERLLRRGIAANMYIHPRELDPNHPHLPLPPLRRFKTYVNIEQFEEKLTALLQGFPSTTFRRFRDMLDDLEKSDRIEEVDLDGGLARERAWIPLGKEDTRRSSKALAREQTKNAYQRAEALPIGEMSRYALTKRVVDLLLAILALLLLSPLLVAVAVILRFTNEREVLFWQQRIGRRNEPFWVWKFVTMRKGSEQHGTITAKNDPRVFPFGRFLRKTKINELPQLVNVSLGEMSIVGPRPQTEECFLYFPEEVRRRAFLCKPGLTGIGSVVFRNEEEIMASSGEGNAAVYSRVMAFKGALELWYLENRSTLVDLKIILLTAISVVLPHTRLATKWFKDLPEPTWEL